MGNQGNRHINQVSIMLMDMTPERALKVCLAIVVVMSPMLLERMGGKEAKKMAAVAKVQAEEIMKTGDISKMPTADGLVSRAMLSPAERAALGPVVESVGMQLAVDGKTNPPM